MKLETIRESIDVARSRISEKGYSQEYAPYSNHVVIFGANAERVREVILESENFGEFESPEDYQGKYRIRHIPTQTNINIAHTAEPESNTDTQTLCTLHYGAGGSSGNPSSILDTLEELLSIITDQKISMRTAHKESFREIYDVCS